MEIQIAKNHQRKRNLLTRPDYIYIHGLLQKMKLYIQGYIYIYIYIYIYTEVINGKKSESMKKFGKVIKK